MAPVHSGTRKSTLVRVVGQPERRPAARVVDRGDARSRRRHAVQGRKTYGTVMVRLGPPLLVPEFPVNGPSHKSDVNERPPTPTR